MNHKAYAGYNENIMYMNPVGYEVQHDVKEWLDTAIGPGNWHYIWVAPNNLPLNEMLGSTSYDAVYIEAKRLKGTGAYFYFESEEDLLLFNMRWLIEGNREPLMWHPV